MASGGARRPNMGQHTAHTNPNGPRDLHYVNLYRLARGGSTGCGRPAGQMCDKRTTQQTAGNAERA
eukprot:10940797-Lingulodinium_polyedra.AAC.1